MRADNEDAPARVFERAAARMLDFDDNRSPFNLARAERWRKREGSRLAIRDDLPRYSWLLTSKERVSSDDPSAYAHVSWLLAQIRSGVLLPALMEQGIEFALFLYWVAREPERDP